MCMPHWGVILANPLTRSSSLCSLMTHDHIATVFYAAAKGLSSDGNWADVSADLRWTAITGITMSPAIDVIITCTICTQLYYSKTDMPQTSSMVHLLTMYTVTTGLIPTLVCFGDMIGYFAAPNTLAYEVCQVLISRAYVNTLMATLNSRRVVRGRRDPSSLVMPSIPGMSFRRPDTFELPSTTVASIADDTDMQALDDVTLGSENPSKYSLSAVA
ncbi:hypothetical protein C8Q72DRAFT_223936 [Fomitopsis betulina]|nr:hypothetical protein C8Q72DRAFT_223936 [Fomitopsis betulina]